MMLNIKDLKKNTVKLSNIMIQMKKALSMKSRGSSVVVGRILNRPFSKEKLSDSELNHHVHIVGASGFGKTVLLTKILKDRIHRGQGCLWLDLKGDREAINEMILDVKKSGREADLKIFSISDSDLSGAYNLVQNGNATEIRDKIMSSFQWSNEFYENEARSYLLKLLIALCSRRDGGLDFDLQDILEGLSDSYVVENLCLSITEAKPRKMAEECYKYLNNKETYPNLAGLRSQIESLVFSDFGNNLRSSKESINLFKATQENKIVFIFLDSRRYGQSAKAIAKIIVKDLVSTSARIDDEIPKNERKPFVCFIDEFADIAQEDFISFPDRARSSKMSLVLCHQEISDLKAISSEFANRLTANMSTLYAFLQSNDESANAISKRAGSQTVWKTTLQTDRFLWWSVSAGKGSKREVEEFRIHPNVIKSLRVGECVVVKKYPYARSHVIRVNMDR